MGKQKVIMLLITYKCNLRCSYCYEPKVSNFKMNVTKAKNIIQEQMDAMKQTLSMLIIDKKKMKLKDANLPYMVLQQTPKYMRRMKMPFVKAKVGPRIMTLIADPKVYEILPVKKEVKAVVSGIYITEIKSVRGGAIPAPPKKKGFFARFKTREISA